MKFFLGMMAGALVTLAAMLFIDDRQETAEVRTSDATEVSDEANSTSVAPVDSSVSAVEAPAARADNTSLPAGEKTAAEPPRGGSATAANAVNRIELPDTHAGFVKKRTRTMADFHAEFEQEETDTAWGPMAEDLVRNFLSSVPEAQSIVVVSLHCRMTQCEVAGTVYGDDPGATWRAVRQSLGQQPWYAEYFDGSAREAGGNLPGEYRFLTFIPRIGTSYPEPGSE